MDYHACSCRCMRRFPSPTYTYLVYILLYRSVWRLDNNFWTYAKLRHIKHTSHQSYMSPESLECGNSSGQSRQVEKEREKDQGECTVPERSMYTHAKLDWSTLWWKNIIYYWNITKYTLFSVQLYSLCLQSVLYNKNIHRVIQHIAKLEFMISVVLISDYGIGWVVCHLQLYGSLLLLF